MWLIYLYLLILFNLFIVKWSLWPADAFAHRSRLEILSGHIICMISLKHALMKTCRCFFQAFSSQPSLCPIPKDDFYLTVLETWSSGGCCLYSTLMSAWPRRFGLFLSLPWYPLLCFMFCWHCLLYVRPRWYAIQHGRIGCCHGWLSWPWPLAWLACLLLVILMFPFEYGCMCGSGNQYPLHTQDLHACVLWVHCISLCISKVLFLLLFKSKYPGNLLRW